MNGVVTAEARTWHLTGERPGPAGYLTVTTRTYVMPDGRESDWDILVGGRTVAALALTPDDRVLLVRQFRPGPGALLLELPGGMVESGEEVLHAAARELAEETGYVAQELTLVGQTWLASYATHQRFAVLATGCRPLGEQQMDSGEFCEVVQVSMDDFLEHTRGGQLTDTDIAFMCLDHLARTSGGGAT